MSGMEVVAVIGCVAAVISAYKDGATIVKSIKDKRARKKAPPPAESLITSLHRGPLAVGEARDSGIKKYGPPFATGDQEAIDALREIVFHLRRTLLRHLCVAQEDDGITDFDILVEISDLGITQSVTVLNELYMRMAQAAPLRHAALPAPGGTFQAAPSAPPTQSPRELGSPPDSADLAVSHTSGKRLGNLPTLGLHKRSARISSRPPSSFSKIDESMFYAIDDKRSLHNSSFGLDTREQGFAVSSQPTIGPLSTFQRKTTDDLSGEATWRPSPEMVINPWVSEVSISTISSDVPSSGHLLGLDAPQTAHSQTQKISTETPVNESDRTARHFKQTQKDLHSLPQSQPTSDVTPLVDGESPQQESKRRQWKMLLMLRKGTNSETAVVTEKSAKTPQGLPMVSRIKSSPQTPGKLATKDPCGGFCMGAYKLQMGLEKESVELKSQSISMTGQSYYWKCANTRCVFETPALKTGKMWTFDDKVHSYSAVRFRWTFLTKSHVAISKAKTSKAKTFEAKTPEYDYQCVFCDRSGQERTIYRSCQAFIEHVSSHRGQPSSTSTSDKVVCITGRIASEEEDFDINLTPRDDMLGLADQVFF